MECNNAASSRSGHGDTIVLHGSDELAVHRDCEASVVVLEYAVHGRAVNTGHAYDNPFWPWRRSGAPAKTPVITWRCCAALGGVVRPGSGQP